MSGITYEDLARAKEQIIKNSEPTQAELDRKECYARLIQMTYAEANKNDELLRQMKKDFAANWGRFRPLLIVGPETQKALDAEVEKWREL